MHANQMEDILYLLGELVAGFFEDARLSVTFGLRYVSTLARDRSWISAHSISNQGSNSNALMRETR